MATGAYQEFVEEFTGSCGCSKVGSFEAPGEGDYLGSAENKAKEAIIAAVVKVGENLGLLKNLPAEISGNVDKILYIIDRMKSQAEFKKDANAHRAICVGVANAINSAVGRNVLMTDMINTPESTELLCLQTVQYLGSLLTGMQSELLAVTGQIGATIKHLYHTRQMLAMNYEALKKQIESSDDSGLKLRVAEFDGVHEALLSFIDGQLEILQNVINMDLKPVEKDISAMIDDKLSLEKYLRSLDKKLGTQDMSQALGQLIKLLGTTGMAAAVIDKALVRVGLSREEYRNMPGLDKFDQVIGERMIEQKLPAEETYEYIKSYKLLRDNFSSRQNIGITGKGEMIGGDGMMSVNKRTEVQRETQKVLFQSFFRNLDTLLKQLASSIELMSMKVGEEVPISEKLDSLSDSLSSMSLDMVFRNRSSWRYLLGYYLDAGAKSMKESAMLKLKTIQRSIEELLEMEMYRNNQHLVSVVNVVKSINGLIERYSSEVNARFGQFEGGDEATTAKEIDAMINAPKFKSTVDVASSMKKLSYRIRVAQIHRNLASSGRDLTEYGEKYDNLVSNSVANILKDKLDKYNALRSWLTERADFKNITGDLAKELGEEAGLKKQHEAALKFLEQQWEARRKFWATVEAIDSYMKVFTDAIVKNPNDIQDIKSMLDDIEVIYEWYTNGMGNKMANVFDKFPTKVGTDLKEATTTLSRVADSPKSETEHYYEHFSDANNLPGIPFNVTWPAKGMEAREQVKEMFKSMSALKNLLSIFVHVGSKFGGEELRKKVFMTPTQIYNNLVEYFTAASFAQGWGLKTDIPMVDKAAANLNNLVEPNQKDQRVNGMGVVEDDAMTVTKGSAKAAWGVSMRAIASNGAHAKQGDDFDEEDAHFVHILKAIAAKILTVTGTYDVFDRPLESNSMRPIRMILGGSSEMPKVEEAAVALYIRLPLLCHFYKDLFGYNNKSEYAVHGKFIANGDKSKITFVPDVDGTYAGLIRLMFRKIQSDDISTYNEEDVKDLIRECNLIYQKSAAKNSQDPIMTAIYGLVDEVNRRYGVVKMDDRDAYEKLNDRFYSTYQADNTSLTSTDYALLPGEEDNEVQQLSGAEKLLGTKLNLNEAQRELKKRGISNKDHYTDLLRTFRCSIDKLFDNVNSNERLAFKSAIKAAQHKIKASQNDTERFKVAADLIRGINIKTQLQGASIIMFHETVVGGLNVLSAIHSLLARFRLRSLLINRKWIEDALVKHAVVGADATALIKILKEAAAKSKITDEATANPLATKFVLGTARVAAAIPEAELEQYRKDANKTTGDKFRALLDEQAMMEELVENLQTLANDFQGMVTIKFDANNMFVNYGGLKSLVEELFAQVNSYMQMLQPLVPEKLYERYANDKVGGFFWLQEQLLSKIIVGRPNQEDSNDRDYDNLDVVFKGLSYTYRRLIEADQEYGNLFAKMIYYDASQTNSGLQKSSEAKDTDAPKLIDWNDAYDSLHLVGPPGKQTLDTRYAARFAQLYTWKAEFTGNRSLLFGFNQLIAKYIQCLYDPATQKIYNGAVSGIANSMFSRSLADPKYTYPDTQAYIWTREYDPRTVPTAPLGLDALAAVRGERDDTKINQIAEDNIKAVLMSTILNELEYIDNSNTGLRSDFAQTLLGLVFANIVLAAVKLNDDTPEAQRMYQLVINSKKPVALADFINGGNSSVEEIMITMVNKPDAKRLENVFGNGNTLDLTANAGVDKYNKRGLSAELKALIKLIDDLELGPNQSNWDQADAALNEIAPYADKDKEANMTYLAALMAAFAGKTADKRKRIMAIVHANVKPGTEYKPAYDSQRELYPKYEDLYLTGKGSASAPAHIVPAQTGDYDKIPGLPKGDTTDPADVEEFGQRKDPDSDHVLFTSLAHVLRNLTSTRSHQNQALVYLFDNVADLPLYLKEKMRANLPLFRNMFKALSQRAEFIREFYVRKQISLVRKNLSGTAVINPWPFGLQTVLEDSQQNKNRFSGIIDTIVRGCAILASACDQQLKEIGDDPKYLETYQNSIRDYRTQYGSDPLMPLSSVLTILRDDNVGADSAAENNKYLPVYAVGEVPFKWHYGVRSLIHQPATIPVLEHVVGFANIAENYNISVDGKYQVDKQKVDAYLKVFTKASRWVYEQRAIRSMLSTYDSLFTVESLVDDVATMLDSKTALISIHEDKNINEGTSANVTAGPVFSIINDQATVMRLTENPTKEERVEELVKHVHEVDSKLASTLAIHNIVDLNIVPINVHALMRDIPLANLYNYSYTFDRLVLETYYENSAAKIKSLCDGSATDSIQSSLDMMVALLQDPYREITDLDYGLFRSMMLGGALNGEMGRPKFLSDQVLGKALFDSPYISTDYKHEVGPVAAMPKTISTPMAFDIMKKVLGHLMIKVFNAANGRAPDVDLATAGGNANLLQAAFEFMMKHRRLAYGDLRAAIAKDAAFVGGAGPLAPTNVEALKVLALIMRLCVTVIPSIIDLYNRGALKDADAMAAECVKHIGVWFAGGMGGATGIKQGVNFSLANSPVAAPSLLTPLTDMIFNEIVASGVEGKAPITDANVSPDLAANNFKAHFGTPSAAPSDKKLIYLSNNDELQEVNVASAFNLSVNGKLRLDTVMTRNLVFIVNLYRTVRLRLQRDLVYSKDVIRRSAPITAESLTEFAMNQALKAKN